MEQEQGQPLQPSTKDFSGPVSSGISQEQMDRVRNVLATIGEVFGERVVGQENLKTALLVSMITGGHVLLESVPGLAKTTAAHTLAKSVNASFKRIQCTPNLLQAILSVRKYTTTQRVSSVRNSVLFMQILFY